MNSIKKDRTGKRYGRLLVVSHSHFDNKNVYWNVRCVCGTDKKVMGNSLQAGNTRSCGCLIREIARNLPRKSTHGMSKSYVYRIWSGMKQRCLNKNSKRYYDYGGRGIDVDEKWLNFETFYNDMGDVPESLTIERINNDKGYSKDNCRWATIKDQMRNKRNNIVLNYNGKSLIVADWSKELGISKSVLLDRFHKGLPISDVFRPCNPVETSKNRRKRPNNSGLPIGVRFMNNGYQARITYHKKQYHLGVYKTPQEAERLYLQVLKFLYGE